jgi:hypothetical protein
MKRFFSSRGPLLDLIYQLHTFAAEELLIHYRKSDAPAEDTDEVILDYLGQLTQIRVLKNSGGKFTVQPSPK